ncbi:hypothetical protein CONLIGDRAFT_684519 [Coniochaeta ligniaria NRRL 30616]|uniref:Uncharacterized protein n=1 Tax=Coniochaeta ligniaria NRRL 30616 TaxID=1408157 RepID=A0A1J7IY23_9PEZI|nr:hypothetical protein CONLIGDRAFT_684519 [Coniochaeta ligniaria NRRL 30616]
MAILKRPRLCRNPQTGAGVRKRGIEGCVLEHASSATSPSETHVLTGRSIKARSRDPGHLPDLPGTLRIGVCYNVESSPEPYPSRLPAQELLHLRTCNGELKFSDWVEGYVRRTDAGRRAVVFPVQCAVLPSAPFAFPRFNPARTSLCLSLVHPVEEQC